MARPIKAFAATTYQSDATQSAAATAAKIKQRAAAAKISYRQLAVATGLTHPTVSAHLNGRNTLFITHLFLYAQALSMDARDLLP